MSEDSYTEVSEQGFFSRLFNSFFSVLFGIAIFLGSFVVIYMNEGSVNEATLCKDAKEVQAASPGGGVGKFVAATGPLDTDEELGDTYLKPEPRLSLSRDAEMFAWVETTTEKKEDKVGGGQRTIKTYHYDRKWTSDPQRSSSFKDQSGHRNPDLTIKDDTQKARAATIGKLSLNMGSLTLPTGDDVRLSDANTKGGDPDGGYLYLDGASPGSPRVGDVRLKYKALGTGGTYTVFGKLESEKAIGPVMVEKREIYRMFAGTKADGLKTMQFEYSMWIWGFRLLGFLMMWGGMRMTMEPINTVLGILPFLGDMGRGLTGFVTFPIALVLTLTTMVVAWILHSLIAMFVVGMLVLVGGVMLFGRKKAVAT